MDTTTASADLKIKANVCDEPGRRSAIYYDTDDEMDGGSGEPGDLYDMSSLVIDTWDLYLCPMNHTNIIPKGMVHRVENGWGLTKVAVVLLNGLLW